MTETCDTCGLPDELCVCEDVAKDSTELSVTLEHRTFNKPVTLIYGATDADIDEGALASELKGAFGCGGTVKNGAIELQGDHTQRVEDELEERGFQVA